MQDQLRICIVEDDCFVSQDIADTISVWMPVSDCSSYDTVGEARRSQEHGGEPDLVVVSANPHGALPINGDDMLWMSRRKVIAVDLQDTQLHPDWLHLRKPFTETELISAVFRSAEQIKKLRKSGTKT